MLDNGLISVKIKVSHGLILCLSKGAAVVQDKSIKNHKATLKRKGLFFFIIASALLLAGVCVYAEPALMVSCAIPAVAGLNAPIVEEERVEAGGNLGQSLAQEEAKDEVLPSQAEPVVKRTLYSR